jgi:hypothetical protein
MKKKTGGGFSKTTVSCMQEVVLRQLVRIAGLHEMTIWRNKKREWHLSVTVPARSQMLTLSTRRAPRVPRAFTRLPCAQRDRTSPTRAAFLGFLAARRNLVGSSIWQHSRV